MSTRAAFWLLFVAALLTVPLPMIQFGAIVPVSRYLLLGGVTLGLIVAEGAGTIPGLLLAVFAVHALVYAALLFACAALVTRGLARLSTRAVGPAAALLAVIALLVASFFDVYTTPFAARSLHTNLLHVLE